MANSLIAHNVDRAPRILTPVAANGEGEVRIRHFQTVQAEAQAVVADIQAQIAAGVQPGDIIVLSQRKTFAIPVYTLLRQQGVPAKSYYAETALHSKEAQERFAILKLYLNSQDRVALRWLLGCHHARWHAPQYARILARFHETGMSPFDIMAALADGALAIQHTSTLVQRFTEIRAEIEHLNDVGDLDEFTTAWLPPSEHTALLAQVVAEHSEGINTVEQLFDSLQREFTQPEIPLEVAEVRVMSFHKSKGLSSPVVYMVGCVDGLIPSRADPQKTPNENAAKLEEDRRLFYVAMTRVKADLEHGKPGYLHLSYPRRMPMADAMQDNIGATEFHGQTAFLHASRFLGELGPQAPQPQAG